MFQKLTRWFRTESAKLAPMSRQQRIEYIRMYYTIHILVTIAAVALLISIASSVAYRSRTVLISGALIDINLSEAGRLHFTDDYWEASGGNKGTRVEPAASRRLGYDPESPNKTDPTAATMVDAMISAGDLDYVITTRGSLEFFQIHEPVLDLESVLPAPLYARLPIIHTQSGASAMDLSGIADTCGLVPSGCYLFGIANTPRPEMLAPFLEYLFP